MGYIPAQKYCDHKAASIPTDNVVDRSRAQLEVLNTGKLNYGHSVIVRLEGKGFLFNCGETTQRDFLDCLTSPTWVFNFSSIDQNNNDICFCK